MRALCHLVYMVTVVHAGASLCYNDTCTDLLRLSSLSGAYAAGPGFPFVVGGSSMYGCAVLGAPCPPRATSGG